MSAKRSLRDRVAFVTGSSGGIGACLARELARQGAVVALAARRAERLAEVAEAVRSEGGVASCHPCDVGDRQGVAKAIDACVSTHGRLDLVANCAGVGRHVAFEDHDLGDIERMLRTNVLGAVYTVHFALPHLRATGGGWIINLSSIAGRLGQPGEAVYSASKFALTGLSEALTLEVRELGIHVLTVYPGLVRTSFVPEDVLARLPTVIVAGALEPEALAKDIVRALRRGRHELTSPRMAAGAYGVRALWPALFRRVLGAVRRG